MNTTSNFQVSTPTNPRKVDLNPQTFERVLNTQLKQDRKVNKKRKTNLVLPFIPKSGEEGYHRILSFDNLDPFFEENPQCFDQETATVSNTDDFDDMLCSGNLYESCTSTSVSSHKKSD